MSNDVKKKVGVFIDYENIHISLLKNSGLQFDPMKMNVFRDVASKYGDVSKIVPIAGWDQFVTHHNSLLEFGYETKQTLSKAKNSSDILFTVECMQTLYENPEIEVYLLFAGDGGYLPLVNHLLNRKKDVYVYSVQGSASSFYVRLGDNHLHIQTELAEYLQIPGTTIDPLLLEVAKNLHKANKNNRKYEAISRKVLFTFILDDHSTFADINTSDAVGTLIDNAIAMKLIYSDTLESGMRVMKVRYDQPAIQGLNLS